MKEIEQQPEFKKEFGNLQSKLKKDLKGIFGSDHQVKSDIAQKNTDQSALPSLLSSKGHESNSKIAASIVDSVTAKDRLKISQLQPRFRIENTNQ